MNDKGGQILRYGRGAILGHPSEDKGCFTSNQKSCLSKFNFLTVVQGKDLEALEGSGLIGLSPALSDKGEMEKPMENGVPGVIAQLFSNADFYKHFDKMFSIYLSNDGSTPGDISFGGFDLSSYAKGKQIHWFEQSSNNNYWSVNSKSVQFN